ncbi:MAG: thioredoxin family protein [Opitutaceae bacterium]
MLTFTAAAFFAAAAPAAEIAKSKIVGLLFYADWCGFCKVLEPKLDAVKKDFAGKSIMFTRVDITDDFTKEQSALLAAQLGLSAAYAENAPKTGFMLLIDPSTGRVLDKLAKTQTEDELKAAINKALST